MKAHGVVVERQLQVDRERRLDRRAFAARRSAAANSPCCFFDLTLQVTDDDVDAGAHERNRRLGFAEQQQRAPDVLVFHGVVYSSCQTGHEVGTHHWFDFVEPLQQVH